MQKYWNISKLIGQFFGWNFGFPIKAFLSKILCPMFPAHWAFFSPQKQDVRETGDEGWINSPSSSLLPFLVSSSERWVTNKKQKRNSHRQTSPNACVSKNAEAYFIGITNCENAFCVLQHKCCMLSMFCSVTRETNKGRVIRSRHCQMMPKKRKRRKRWTNGRTRVRTKTDPLKLIPCCPKLLWRASLRREERNSIMQNRQLLLLLAG